MFLGWQDARASSIFSTALSEAMCKPLPPPRVAAVKLEGDVAAGGERGGGGGAGGGETKTLESQEPAQHVEEWRYAAVTVSVLALASAPPPPLPGSRTHFAPPPPCCPQPARAWVPSSVKGMGKRLP